MINLGDVKLYRELHVFELPNSIFIDLVLILQDDFDAERETNLAAVVASLQLWGIKDVVNILSFSVFVRNRLIH